MQPVAVVNTGATLACGLSAPAACAAISGGIDNFQESRFIDSTGEWIVGSQVPLEEDGNSIDRLACALQLAIEEALSIDDSLQLDQIPCLLGFAEQERAGYDPAQNDAILDAFLTKSGVELHPLSRTMPYGRVFASVAFFRARELLYEHDVHAVVIAAADSLLSAGVLNVLDNNGRLLTQENSNGLRPGEGASALVVCKPVAGVTGQLLCKGIGFGTESATIWSTEPFRGDGLTKAVQAALSDAGAPFDAIDLRVADVSGEQYYFKEAELVVSRLLRTRKEILDFWHPAECVGEIGAAAGLVCVASILDAQRNGYAPGSTVLYHGGTDHGPRGALLLSLE